MGTRRTCVGCRRVASPAQLVRVVVDDAGRLRTSRTAPGRGAWLCARNGSEPEPACVERAIKRRAFERAFRRSLPPDAARGLADSSR